jgi:hypothetical protein
MVLSDRAIRRLIEAGRIDIVLVYKNPHPNLEMESLCLQQR